MCPRPLLPGLFLQEYLGKPVATVEAFRNLWFHTVDAAYCDDAGAFPRRGSCEDVSSFQMEDLAMTLSVTMVAAGWDSSAALFEPE
jgi:crotonobetaine/carnitine-CoA ligase